MIGASRVGSPNPPGGSGDGLATTASPLEKSVLLALLALLALVAIQTLYPLLQVGLIRNDDLKLGNAALDRGMRGVASVLWAFTRRDGRLDLAQMASWYLPFALDSFVYFKCVSLAAIVADLLLFACFARSVFRSDRAFVLALLLSLVGLQNSWEHSALTAFPGLFTFMLAYLLCSLLAFQRFLARGGARWLALSAALYLLARCSYEMYIVYLPVFLGLGSLAGGRAATRCAPWRPTSSWSPCTSPCTSRRERCAPETIRA